MTSTLMIIQFVLTIVITIAILLQKSASMGLGAYSGSNDSMFGAKGPTHFLAKATFILGILIVLNTLYLGYLYNQENTKSVVDSVKLNTIVPTIPTTTPHNTQAPQAPTTTK